MIIEHSGKQYISRMQKDLKGKQTLRAKPTIFE